MTTKQDNTDLDLSVYFEEFYTKIEAAWCENRDWKVVVDLATANPSIADFLYDFFEALVEGDYEELYSFGDQVISDSSNIDAHNIWDWYNKHGKSIAFHGGSPLFENSPSIGEDQKLLSATSEPLTSHRPLIGYLKEVTGDSPMEIANALRIDFGLLSLISRYPEAVPDTCKYVIKDRIACAYNERLSKTAPVGVPHDQIGGYRMAAHRKDSYSEQAVTWAVILKMAKLVGEELNFWQRTAEQKNSHKHL